MNPEMSPQFSSDYHWDGAVAEEFFEKSELLWSKAKEWFPSHHKLKAYQDMNQFQTTGDDAEERLCGLWMGCSVNIAEPNDAVETEVHRDLGGFFFMG
jgi:hypothetical protein